MDVSHQRIPIRDFHVPSSATKTAILARVDNVTEFLKVADGVIVGSSLKQDGYTWNPVDPDRVRAFMNRVRESRQA